MCLWEGGQPMQRPRGWRVSSLPKDVVQLSEFGAMLLCSLLREESQQNCGTGCRKGAQSPDEAV